MRGLLKRMRRGTLMLAIAAGCLGSTTNVVHARDFAPRVAPAWVQNFSPVIPVSKLPVAAARLLATIRAGGEFPYEKDGAIFGNRERLLPRQPRGYYREYTVPTPRARDRGARRIVCGGPPRTTDECYYTDDHYSSFKRIQG